MTTTATPKIPDSRPVELSRSRHWLLAAAIVMEAAWIVVLAVLAITR
jgi:hypothetical protein